jgi:ClpP class serine protease
MNSKEFKTDNLQLIDLTEEEQVNINGGQDEITILFWEYVGKGLGHLHNACKHIASIEVNCSSSSWAGPSF